MFAHANKMFVDRRRIAPRYEFTTKQTTPVRVATAKDQDCTLGYLKNVSWSGLCFAAPLMNSRDIFEQKLKQDEYLQTHNKLEVDKDTIYDLRGVRLGDELRIELAPLGSQPMSFRAEVVRIETKGEEVMYGVKFLDVPFVYMERLAQQIHNALLERDVQDQKIFKLEEEKAHLKKRMLALMWFSLCFAAMAAISILAL